MLPPEAIFKGHTAQPYFHTSFNKYTVGLGGSFVSQIHIYNNIYIYTHMTYDHICMYIYTVSISPNPLSLNVHFPVSIVAFQCHALKLQDRIHLNIAVAGPTSTLAEETNHSVACGPICFPYVVHGNKKLKAAGQPLVLPPWVSASSG